MVIVRDNLMTELSCENLQYNFENCLNKRYSGATAKLSWIDAACHSKACKG
jgi:hypothetical protein